MNISISHNLTYQYSNKVSLDPHGLYLFPKINESLSLLNFNLEISPEPSQIYHNTDLEGNIQTIAFFNKTTDFLSFNAKIEVKTQAFNPFDFVFFPFNASSLPFIYTADEQMVLAPYLQKNGITTLIDQTARSIAAESGWQTSKYLMNLCGFINKNFNYLVREEGQPFEPEYTLLQKSGSCRDFSVLFIAFCRTIGLAARFVSGYYYSKTLVHNYLHAWVEVYLPGGGWRGFDPTQNTAVSNHHIPIAASVFPEKIGPVTGSFRGKSSSLLETEVIVREIN